VPVIAARDLSDTGVAFAGAARAAGSRAEEKPAVDGFSQRAFVVRCAILTREEEGERERERRGKPLVTRRRRYRAAISVCVPRGSRELEQHLISARRGERLHVCVSSFVQRRNK